MAYELNNGRVYIWAYVEEPGKATAVTLRVAANITRTTNGMVNKAAELSLMYQPRDIGVDYASLGMGTAIMSVATGSVSAQIMAGLLAPLTPPGESSTPIRSRPIATILWHGKYWEQNGFYTAVISSTAGQV